MAPKWTESDNRTVLSPKWGYRPSKYFSNNQNWHLAYLLHSLGLELLSPYWRRGLESGSLPMAALEVRPGVAVGHEVARASAFEADWPSWRLHDSSVRWSGILFRAAPPWMSRSGRSCCYVHIKLWRQYLLLLLLINAKIFNTPKRQTVLMSESQTWRETWEVDNIYSYVNIKYRRLVHWNMPTASVRCRSGIWK